MKFVLAALVTLVTASSEPSFNDATYLKKTAAEKAAQIWSQGITNVQPQGWYNALEMAGLLTESMNPTLS